MAAKRGRSSKPAAPTKTPKPRGRPPKTPPATAPAAAPPATEKPLLEEGKHLPSDPVDASLALMRAQLERATKTSEAANIGRAIAALSAEARKREDALVKRMGRMTLPEKVEFTKTMVEEWPAQHRVAFRDWILALEPPEGSP